MFSVRIRIHDINHVEIKFFQAPLFYFEITCITLVILYRNEICC